MAKAGLGIGFVPEKFLAGVSGIRVIRTEQPLPEREIRIVFRKNQPLSIAARRLEQMLLSDFSRGGTDEGPAE